MSSGFSGSRFLALAFSAAVIAAAAGCLGDGPAEPPTPKPAVQPAHTPPPAGTSTPVPSPTLRPRRRLRPLLFPRRPPHRRLRPPPFQRRRPSPILARPTLPLGNADGYVDISSGSVHTCALRGMGPPSAGAAIGGANHRHRRVGASSPSAAAASTPVLSGKMGVPIAGETMSTVSHRHPGRALLRYQRWPYPHLCAEGGRNSRLLGVRRVRSVVAPG